jgi:hypothetical protein
MCKRHQQSAFFRAALMGSRENPLNGLEGDNGDTFNTKMYMK